MIQKILIYELNKTKNNSKNERDLYKIGYRQLQYSAILFHRNTLIFYDIKPIKSILYTSCNSAENRIKKHLTR